MLTAVYPGTFNPPTVAHLAVARAATEQGGVDRVDLVLSRRPLGKEDLDSPSVGQRLAVLEAVAATRSWLGARVSDWQLLVDIGAGADAVIVGADKWAQLLDPAWYGGDRSARDAALASLPMVLVAPRPPHGLPRPQSGRVQLLRVDPEHSPVSSTAVRAGDHRWILPEARASGLWSG